MRCFWMTRRRIKWRGRGLYQPWVPVARFQNQGAQFSAADHARDLSESEERQQQNEAHDTHGQQASGIPSEKWRKAFSEGMPMPQTYRNGFDDMEADKHHTKDEALVQNGVNEGAVTEAVSQVEVLTEKKNLCEDECVNDREGVFLGIQMVLRQHDAFVDGEKPEDNPEIEEDYEKAPEFFGGLLF
jgi:hypothetical protein